MNYKSMLDRDNTELFIMSDEECKEWDTFLSSKEFVDWQEQIYEQEILKRGGGDEKFGDIKDSFQGIITFYHSDDSIIHSELFNITSEQLEVFNIDVGEPTISDLLKSHSIEELVLDYYANKVHLELPFNEWEYEEIVMMSESEYKKIVK